MRQAWDDALRRGTVGDLERLWGEGADLDARDRHGQTALMRAAVGGRVDLVTWLVARGATLDHTAKYGLSALMLAVVNGHSQVARVLLDAGADRQLRGTGAPAFAGRTALDLAVEQGDPVMVAHLRAPVTSSESPHRNPHFQPVSSWTAAQPLLTFTPCQLADTAGQTLLSLRVHVRDHKRRELRIEDRSLEAHYGRFVFSQVRKSRDEARRLALDVSYGLVSRDVTIGGNAGRRFALGPVPAPDDIDGRSPAVVVWSDGDIFYLVASEAMSDEELAVIAGSVFR